MRLAPPVCFLCLLATATAWAGGFTLTSFGGRRGGMLANLGRPDEPTALIHNPAGLADQPGVQLYLFVSPTLLSLDIEMQALDPARFPAINAEGCGEPGAAPCAWPIGADGYYVDRIRPERYFGVLPYLGASADLGFLGAKDVVVSVAGHAPNFYGAYFPEDAPSAYNFIGGMFLVTGVTAGAGWRINRLLSVGASASYHYMAISLAQKLSPANMLTPQGEAPGVMAKLAQVLLGDIRLDYSGTDHGVGWGAGLLLTPLPWLDIGLSYSGATPAAFSGDVTLEALGLAEEQRGQLGELAGRLGYKLPRALQIEMAIPPSLAGGINVALGPAVELGLDLRFWLYNLYDRQTITPVYDDDEAGEPAITEEMLSRDKDYHLSYQVSAGVLVRPFTRWRQVELMTGAGYDQSPIPDETLTLDNPSLSQVKLTWGLRWQIDGHVRVSASYLLVIYIPRDITTSQTRPPTNVRGGGFSHSPALAVTYRF